MTYSDNAIAVILLCSQLGVMPQGVKPFIIREWNELVLQLKQSTVKEPANLLPMTADEIQQALSISPAQAHRIFALLARGGNIVFLLNQLAQKAIYVITRSEPGYPVRLRKVLEKNAPPLLYFCGDLSLANREGLAIVGSRDIDADGVRFAQTLAKKTVESGYVVYSGGAKGVDEISEQSALKNNGCCISFLSDSMERKIRNPAICNAVRNNKMLLLSAVNPSAGFQVGNAMGRNKYVYALSLGAVVVASDYGKGGTWNGAIQSIKTRLVNTYVWNTAKYKGNQPLIQAGGLPLADDFEKLSILDLLMAGEPVAEPKKKSPDTCEQQRLSDLSIAHFSDSDAKMEKDLLKPEQTLPVDGKTEGTSEPIKSDQEIAQDAIYKTILPILLHCAQEPITIDEMAKQLNLLKKQTEIWVKYAVEASQMKKLTRPVRYVRSD